MTADINLKGVEQAEVGVVQELESQRGDLSKKDTELTDRLRARLARISIEGEVLLLPRKFEATEDVLPHVLRGSWIATMLALQCPGKFSTLLNSGPVSATLFPTFFFYDGDRNCVVR